MAIERTLSDITQEQFDAAEGIIIELLRAGSPTLDLRKGTAIRDLIVRPAAEFHALNTLRIDDLRNSNSLKTLNENPDLGDDDVVDGLLSNLGYSRQPGEFAEGVVRVTVTIDKDYSVPNRFELKDGSDFVYVTEQQWTVRSEPIVDPTSELQLFPDSTTVGEFYFLLPMIGQVEGANYQAGAGEVLTPVSREIAGVSVFEVFTDFSGGINQETTENAIAQLPASLSYRAFESNVSINTRLRNVFPSLVSSHSIGYGEEAQLRDKHNIFGTAVGNKVDTYIRTFRAPVSRLLEKTGTKLSDGVYQFQIARTDAPGFSIIRGIAAIGQTVDGTTTGTEPIIGSLPFTEVRSASGTEDTHHEFSPDNIVVETAFTVWQESTVTVTDVQAIVEGGSATYPDTLQFTVELFVPPDLSDIQSYIDYDTIRNLEADQVARGALVCLVSVQATLYHDPEVVLDLDLITQVIVDYINNKTFGEALTASEVTAIIHQFDVTRVNLDDASDAGLKLIGSIRDAAGNTVDLSGNILDINNVADPANFVTPNTVVFATDSRNIFLKDIEA
jgi:hypothetical protein